MIKMLFLGILLLVASYAPQACAGTGGNPTVQLAKEDSEETIIRKAAGVLPTSRQLAWQEDEFACFVHFGMNTFTDREWGEGTEDPKIFNPTALDARQWAKACKDAGMRKLILTAKHHDGFCLWPSKFTEHSVKSSPWKNGQGDVVREAADACREAGLKFGVYCSPWDRHEPTYGDSPKYNQHFLDQLRELLTQYGPIAEVWFDGACGEGPNGKKQVYDWDAYYALVRELQPNAAISICGPDVRWVGNEAGETRSSEWSVIPEDAGAMDKDLGSRARLLQAAQAGVALKWSPSQTDVSIRPGWFYHPAEDDRVKSLNQLLDIYYGAVGGNSELLLNVPPDRRGLFHENDVRRLRELGASNAATFEKNLLAGAKVTASAGEHPEFTVDDQTGTYWTPGEGTNTATLEYDLGSPQTFNCALLQEYLPMGQQVEEFVVEAEQDGQWKLIAQATVIGHKRLLRFDNTTAQRVRVRITQSRVCPVLSNVGLFQRTNPLMAPNITRNAKGEVVLEAQPLIGEIRYWLSHWPADGSSKRYTGPIAFPRGGVVKAVPIPPACGAYVRSGVVSPYAQAEFAALAGIPGENELAPAKPEPSAWWCAEKIDVFPARTTEAFPLSDQENRSGWSLYAAFSDEFDGEKLDADKWWDHNPTWLGRPPAFFDPRNVTVSDGKLNLAMRKQEAPEAPKDKGYHTYTSAAVKSKKLVRYGYFEVKAKAMASAGSSSFWFYQDDAEWWTEIDVFEIGGKAPGFENKHHITQHVMRTPAEDRHWSIGAIYQAPVGLADDYHVYGLEWDENELKYYFDGALVRRGPNTQWRQPLRINFDSETMPDWFGLPKDEDLPSTYSIEYLRVWKR